MQDGFYEAVCRLPPEWREGLMNVHPELAIHISEIRLRSNCPIAVTWKAHPYFVTYRGEFQEEISKLTPIVTHKCLQECFSYLCRYSIFAYEEQLKQGYFTLAGGHRVGVAASAVYNGEKIMPPHYVTSLNIRIARKLKLCEDQEYEWRKIIDSPVLQILIAGSPGSGKSTLLRALAYLLSAQGRTVTVLDERCELFPLGPNGFCWPQPYHCDIISGYSKAQGMALALRSLSPEVFLCDELGGTSEIAQLRQSLNSGVGFVATVHAGSWEEIQRKSQWKPLLESGICQAVLLCDRSHPCRIREVHHV